MSLSAISPYSALVNSRNASGAIADSKKHRVLHFGEVIRIDTNQSAIRLQNELNALQGLQGQKIAVGLVYTEPNAYVLYEVPLGVSLDVPNATDPFDLQEHLIAPLAGQDNSFSRTNELKIFPRSQALEGPYRVINYHQCTSDRSRWNPFMAFKAAVVVTGEDDVEAYESKKGSPQELNAWIRQRNFMDQPLPS